MTLVRHYTYFFTAHVLREITLTRLDLELLVETFKFSRKIADTEPFKAIICEFRRKQALLMLSTDSSFFTVKETAPGAGVVSDEDIRSTLTS